MSSRTAMMLAAQDGPWAQLRTGTVVQASGGTAVVVVGATTFEASIIAPFGIADPGSAVPPAGALVMVGRQDSSWAVLGAVLGASGNLVPNGSFEDSPPGSEPLGWTLYALTGTGEATVTDEQAPVAGAHTVLVTTVSVNAHLYLYSGPIPVVEGDVLQLSVFASAVYEDGAPETSDVDLYALWFATDTDLYPDVSHPATQVDSVANLPAAPLWTPLSGTITAPVSGFLRVALRSDINVDQATLWDFAVARRVS